MPPKGIESVLCCDNVDLSCSNLLRSRNVHVCDRPCMPKEELIDEIQKYEVIIVRSETKLSAAILSFGKKLKIVGRAGTGTDNIDMNYASSVGIIVLNSPGGNSISACELTCTFILGLSRKMMKANRSLVAGKWARKELVGFEVYGKTLGIVGLGKIGSEVSKRMKAFGMKVIAYDPVINKIDCRKQKIHSVSLTTLLKKSDFITVHTPLIPATKGLINAKTLATCKDNVCIVNVARGGIVDEQDLLDYLDSHKFASAALDVFSEEPPLDKMILRLINHPQVIATPHLGANTTEAQRRVAFEVAQQIICLYDFE